MVEQYSQYGTVPRCTKIGKHNYTLEFDIFLKNKHLKNEIYIRVTTYIDRVFFLFGLGVLFFLFKSEYDSKQKMEGFYRELYNNYKE